MESYKVFDESFHSFIKDGVSLLQLQNEEKEENTNQREILAETPIVSSSLSCSYCRVEFSTPIQQREHCKLDWHRYNLKQNLASKAPISIEEFEAKTDDVSSISGSDTEEEETLDTIASSQGKIFLKNNTGQVFGMYKCLLANKKEDIDGNTAYTRLMEYHQNKQWAVFMLGGGHFAGAIFKNEEAIFHKTFHCYTVRAGQGGTQSSRDNSGGSHPKSAGASLRRYNENALMQHVKDIIEAWKAELATCSLIILRAAGPYNKGILYGGKVPLLDRFDPRIRVVPFSTRRATFTEVKRVHGILSTVFLYDSIESALKGIVKHTSPDRVSKRTKVKISNVNRAKSREIVERVLPRQISEEAAQENDIQNTPVKSKRGKKLEDGKLEDSKPEDAKLEGANKENQSSDEQEYHTEELTINFAENLQCFDDSLTPEERAKKSSRLRQKTKKQKEKKLREMKKTDVMNSVKNGDLTKFIELKDMDNEDIAANGDIINELYTETGDCLLHVAAKHCQKDMILFLLEHGADVCAKNDKQETPYTCTKDKLVRDLFRSYAAENPEKHNYNKANIPTNTLTAAELTEKKRQQRKVKREKEKEKKKENEVKKQEENAKERFLQLSDREKRALAAERRILNQDGVVIVRCFLCASDMAGKVPFEYGGNRFCTIECLKAHRMQHPTNLS